MYDGAFSSVGQRRQRRGQQQPLHYPKADQTGQTGSAVVVDRPTAARDGEQPCHKTDHAAGFGSAVETERGVANRKLRPRH